MTYQFLTHPIKPKDKSRRGIRNSVPREDLFEVKSKRDEGKTGC